MRKSLSGRPSTSKVTNTRTTINPDGSKHIVKKTTTTTRPPPGPSGRQSMPSGGLQYSLSGRPLGGPPAPPTRQYTFSGRPMSGAAAGAGAGPRRSSQPNAGRPQPGVQYSLSGRPLGGGPPAQQYSFSGRPMSRPAPSQPAQQYSFSGRPIGGSTSGIRTVTSKTTTTLPRGGKKTVTKKVTSPIIPAAAQFASGSPSNADEFEINIEDLSPASRAIYGFDSPIRRSPPPPSPTPRPITSPPRRAPPPKPPSPVMPPRPRTPEPPPVQRIIEDQTIISPEGKVIKKHSEKTIKGPAAAAAARPPAARKKLVKKAPPPKPAPPPKVDKKALEKEKRRQEREKKRKEKEKKRAEAEKRRAAREAKYREIESRNVNELDLDALLDVEVSFHESDFEISDVSSVESVSSAEESLCFGDLDDDEMEQYLDGVTLSELKRRRQAPKPAMPSTIEFDEEYVEEEYVEEDEYIEPAGADDYAISPRASPSPRLSPRVSPRQPSPVMSPRARTPEAAFAADFHESPRVSPSPRRVSPRVSPRQPTPVMSPRRSPQQPGSPGVQTIIEDKTVISPGGQVTQEHSEKTISPRRRTPEQPAGDEFMVNLDDMSPDSRAIWFGSPEKRRSPTPPRVSPRVSPRPSPESRGEFPPQRRSPSPRRASPRVSPRQPTPVISPRRSPQQPSPGVQQIIEDKTMISSGGEVTQEHSEKTISPGRRSPQAAAGDEFMVNLDDMSPDSRAIWFGSPEKRRSPTPPRVSPRVSPRPSPESRGEFPPQRRSPSPRRVSPRVSPRQPTPVMSPRRSPQQRSPGVQQIIEDKTVISSGGEVIQEHSEKTISPGRRSPQAAPADEFVLDIDDMSPESREIYGYGSPVKRRSPTPPRVSPRRSPVVSPKRQSPMQPPADEFEIDIDDLSPDSRAIYAPQASPRRSPSPELQFGDEYEIGLDELSPASRAIYTGRSPSPAPSPSPAKAADMDPDELAMQLFGHALTPETRAMYEAAMSPSYVSPSARRSPSRRPPPDQPLHEMNADDLYFSLFGRELTPETRAMFEAEMAADAAQKSGSPRRTTPRSVRETSMRSQRSIRSTRSRDKSLSRVSDRSMSRTPRRESPDRSISRLSERSQRSTSRSMRSPSRSMTMTPDRSMSIRETPKRSIKWRPRTLIMSPDSSMLSDISDRPSPRRTMTEELMDDVENLSMSHPGTPIQGRAVTQEEVEPVIVMTPQGPVRAIEQVTVGETIRRTPDHEIVSRKVETVESDTRGHAFKTTLDTAEVDLLGTSMIPEGISDTPSKELMEVVTTQSVLETGIKQTTRTVAYETTKPKEGHDEQEIAAMVEEEIEDIEETLRAQAPELVIKSPENYSLKKKLQSLQLKTDSVTILEQSIVPPQPTPDEEQEEIQPELMASIMHTEEIGVTLGTKPTQMYHFLFPDHKTENILNVSAVAPGPLEDVVVPLKSPSNLQIQAFTHEVSVAFEEVHMQFDVPPADDIYSEQVAKKESPRVANVAHIDKKKSKPAKKPAPSLDKEEAPWAIDEGIEEIVGADVSRKGDESFDLSKSNIEEEANRIEYILQMDFPVYMSRVQLRGSQAPSWFPGYVSAFPDIPDLIRIEKSPSLVLTNAWKAVQPDHFPESSFIGS